MQAGEIEIRVNIVQREYKKFVVNKSGDVVTDTFTVYGRKHPLSNLRAKLLKKHHHLMRLNSDDYFDNIQGEELFRRLNLIGELNLNENINDMKQKLKNMKDLEICKCGMMHPL